MEFLSYFTSLLHLHKTELVLVARRAIVTHCIKKTDNVREREKNVVQLREFTSLVFEVSLCLSFKILVLSLYWWCLVSCGVVH